MDEKSQIDSDLLCLNNNYPYNPIVALNGFIFFKCPVNINKEEKYIKTFLKDLLDTPNHINAYDKNHIPDIDDFLFFSPQTLEDYLQLMNPNSQWFKEFGSGRMIDILSSQYSFFTRDFLSFCGFILPPIYTYKKLFSTLKEKEDSKTISLLKEYPNLEEKIERLPEERIPNCHFSIDFKGPNGDLSQMIHIIADYYVSLIRDLNTNNQNIKPSTVLLYCSTGFPLELLLRYQTIYNAVYWARDRSWI